MPNREPLEAIYIYTPSPGEEAARQRLIELLAGLLDNPNEQVGLVPSSGEVVGCAVAKKKTSSRSTRKAKTLASLTWDSLEKWAGRRIVQRGRTYHRQKAVKDLAQTSGGAVVAWVQGERRYATKVEIDSKGKLQSVCTCPYYTTCKHAVAVVLAYLDELKNDRVVPLAPDDDQRLAEIAEMENRAARLSDVDDADDDGDDLVGGDWEEDDEEYEAPPPRRSKAIHRRTPSWQALLVGLTRDQLVGLVEELAVGFDGVRSLLEHRSSLLKGREGELLKKVRAAIRDLHEPQWDEDWGHPNVDLDQLKEQLEALLKKGHADALVQLGPDLLTGAGRTVESEHEGESAYELGQCLTVVFRALRQSSLAQDAQVDVAMQMKLADEYDLCGDAPRKIFNRRYRRDVWRAVAARLQDRLGQLKPPAGKDSFGTRRHRDRLVDFLVQALEKAGQKGDVIPLCEREAPATNNYGRLVDRLVAARRMEEAERWCVRGLQEVGEYRGVAAELRRRLEQICGKRGEPLRAVALKADVFFEEPSLKSFQDLTSAARKAKVGPAVDAWARHFLVTGRRPMPGAKGKRAKDELATPWPLPESGVVAHPSRRQLEVPMINVLIQIAIAEKNADEVLRWYDDQRGPRGWRGALGMEVAGAIGGKYPDRAVAIYKKHAEAAINRVNPRGYEDGAAILRRAKQVLLKAGRKEEWATYMAQLREKNRGRPRCIKELDRLEKGSRRIVED